MQAKLRSSVSYANVMATIAVFVTLGGTSYALATGSIDSREIKNNTVRGKDIRNGTVRSSDVRNGTLLGKDFRAGELPAGPFGARGATGARGAKGETGPQGATGAQGSPGAPGRDGADGVSDYMDAAPGSSSSSLPANTFRILTATCPAGRRAVGGGFSLASTDATVVEDFQVLTSQRAASNADWQVIIRNTNDTLARTLNATATAVCVLAR